MLPACSLGGKTEQRRAGNATLEYKTLADLISMTGHSQVDMLKVGRVPEPHPWGIEQRLAAKRCCHKRHPLFVTPHQPRGPHKHTLKLAPPAFHCPSSAPGADGH